MALQTNHVGGDDVVNTGEYYDPQTRGLARLVHRFAFGEFFSALFYAIISSGAVLASGVLTMRLENSQHTAGRLLMIALANGLGFAALLYTLDAYRDAHFRYDERQNFVALQVHAEVWVQVNASTGWCVAVRTPQNCDLLALHPLPPSSPCAPLPPLPWPLPTHHQAARQDRGEAQGCGARARHRNVGRSLRRSARSGRGERERRRLQLGRRVDREARHSAA